jgi:transcriptional antiterminator RfaH
MNRWYLVQTKPAGEVTALRNLARQGYEVYYPRLAQSVVYAGKMRERVGALFPRYIFVRVVEGAQALAPINSSKGVLSVVRFGATYAHVPDQVVDELRARADAFTGLHRLRADKLSRGTAVRIIAGPFEGLEGVFGRHVGPERVTVLLTLLGQNSSVRISNEYVVRSNAS